MVGFQLQRIYYPIGLGYGIRSYSILDGWIESIYSRSIARGTLGIIVLYMRDIGYRWGIIVHS